MDEYRLLSASGETIAIGTRDRIFRFVKHHVADGRYRIVGSEVKLHVVREQGIVGPDPDGVCLKRAGLSDDALGSLRK
jgi:hypothetical protein